MPTWIDITQNLLSRLTGRPQLFAFTRVEMGPHGNANPRRHAWQVRLGRMLGVRLFSRVYPGIPGRVHVHDTMLVSESADSIAHYIALGTSAVEHMERALAATGRSFADVRAFLDMGCGFGRVLRHVAARMNPRVVTACDIDDEAVRFCAAEFGALPLLSQPDFSRIGFPATYDVIWAGSLFTHLPPETGFGLLGILSGRLNPGGLLMFTTQGEGCLEHLGAYGPMFAGREPHYRGQIASDGAGYLPYDPAQRGYGIAIYPGDVFRKSVEGRLGDTLRFVSHAPRGWDNHQDIWAFRRVGA